MKVARSLLLSLLLSLSTLSLLSFVWVVLPLASLACDPPAEPKPPKK